MTQAPKKPKVLIVEDDQELRQVLALGLRKAGYDPCGFGEGLKALAAAREGGFVLALLDLGLPDIGGLELLTELKRADAGLEVLVITGSGAVSTAVESMRRGAYDYLSKPFETRELLGRVEKALENRGLRLRVGELEEIQRLKDEFVANMSHELRTPMNAVLGYTSLLLEGLYGELNAEQQNSLKRVESNAMGLLSLINDILDYSKLSAGKMQVNLEAFELRPLMQEVLDTAVGLARGKELDCALEWGLDGQPGLVSDPQRLRQILFNLAANAVKFTSKGRVTLRARPAQRESWIRLEVEDSGIGIPQDKLPLLFKDFSQVDPSLTRQYGGTGLGLAICKKLSEALGGSIEVSSEAGRGSLFGFELPLKAAGWAS